MNITVLGAGAVGGYFGARLADVGANITFLVREKRRQQLEKEGLHVQSVNGDTSIEHPQVTTDPSTIEKCDLIILSVKGYHLDATYPMLEPLVENGAKILPLLNGVEHYDVLEQRFGKDAVIGGLCFLISTLDDGKIVHTSKQHDMTFGEMIDTQKETCQQLAELCEKANLNYTYSDNILFDIWNKYAFITAYSGITTASRLEIGTIRSQPETFELYKDTAEEMKHLASAYGVDLGEAFIKSMEEKAFQFPVSGTSSLHQDLRKGLPLELENLQGGALRLGKKKGLELPIIQTFYRLLKPFEKGTQHK